MSDLIAQLKRMPEYDELRWAAIFELERLQAVVDAAREACLEVINAPRIMEEVRDTADDILRALDGEVKPCPTCDGSGLDESGERQCQRCNGRGRLDGEVKP